MSKQLLWSRWYRFDSKGVKYIKKFEINEAPAPSMDIGFTEWKRGTGPLSPAQYENITNAVRRSCTGVPKSPATKYKMSVAKKGIPKSEQHKQNMRDAWARRKRDKANRDTTQVRHQG
jgi:hypothetical protein